MVTGACYNNHMLAPQELYKLNGFREGQTVILNSVDGDNVKFSRNTQLNVTAADGQAMTAKYASVQVNGSTMTGVVRGSGAPVNIDLSQVTSAQAKTLSLGKTIGLAVGLGVGIPVVLAITIWVILFVTVYRAVGLVR
jgi:hypothetical protein